jgi:stearoyl-CoA desaturase (delta-9 desaturase)
MLYFGALACQGPLLFWVALHRGLHHRYADTPKDPHSPIHGFWRSYQEYAFDTANLGVPLTAAKDLLRQDHLKWIEKHYLVTVRLTWLVVALVSLFSWSCAPILGLVMAQVWGWGPQPPAWPQEKWLWFGPLGL